MADDPIISFRGDEIDAATARALVADTLIEGNAVSSWWTRQSADFLNGFMDQMRTSMQNGESITQAITRVTGGTIDGVAVPGMLATSKRKAGALVSSAINAVTNDARLRTFQSNDDVVKGIQQVTTFDNRTSDICIAYSGKAWKIDTLEPIDLGDGVLPFNGGPPRHFNCRSTLIPILKSFEELGFNLKEIPPGTRATMDGQVPSETTFNQWLSSKPRTFQDRILGPARARLWRNGEITLTQLVDMRGNPMTIGQLEGKVGVKPSPPPPKPPPPPVALAPQFKTNKQAAEWVGKNVTNHESPYSLAERAPQIAGDKDAIRMFSNVTLMMRDRFKMTLPNFLGPSSKHPRIRFRRSSYLAAVHMETDSLLLRTRGLRVADAEKDILAARYNYFGRTSPEGKKIYSGNREAKLATLDKIRSQTEGNTALHAAMDAAKEADDLFFTAYGGSEGDGLQKIWLTAIHESGHRMHAQYKAAFDEILGTIRYENSGRSFWGWARVTSEYAGTNMKEFLAEQFVRYMMGDEVRVHPLLLKKFKELDRGGAFADDLFQAHSKFGG